MCHGNGETRMLVYECMPTSRDRAGSRYGETVKKNSRTTVSTENYSFALIIRIYSDTER